MASYKLIETSEQTERLLRRLSVETLGSLIALDIETTGLNFFQDDILLIQFQIPSTGEIYILNCRKLSREDQLRILKALHAENRSCLIGHNLKFDLSFLLAKFPEVYFTNVRDTFITEQLITNGLVFKPPSLADLCLKYLNIELDKEERKSFIGFKGDTFSKKQLEYGARDIEFIRRIYADQMKYVNQYGLNFINEVEGKTVAATALLEVTGIFVSREKWQENEIIAKNHKLNVLERMNEWALKVLDADLLGFPAINWNSPIQLLSLIQKLVDPKIKDTNERTLEGHKHPFLDLLLEYREYNKLITSYGESVLKLVSPITGRLHPSFNQLGAKSGRFAVKSPNVQQIPKNTIVGPDGKKHAIYREAFKPQISSGKIVGADYSSFELRVLTDLTKEPEWIKGYTEDKDMHSVVASFIFGVPVSKKTNPELRDIGKSINFG